MLCSILQASDWGTVGMHRSIPILTYRYRFVTGDGLFTHTLGLLSTQVMTPTHIRTQFAVFEALYTKWDDEAGRTEIPHTQ